MKFALWTRSFWVVLVHLAHNPEVARDPRDFVAIWRGLATALPCAKCRDNFKRKALNVDAAAARGTRGLADLVLRLRNAIEASQHKPLTSRAQQDAFFQGTRNEVGAAFSGVLWAVASDWDARMSGRAPSRADMTALESFVSHLVRLWPGQDVAKRARMVQAVTNTFWHTRVFGQVPDSEFTGQPGQMRVFQVLPALKQFQRRFDLPALPDISIGDQTCSIEECGHAALTAPALFRVHEWQNLCRQPPFRVIGLAFLFTVLLLFVVGIIAAVHQLVATTSTSRRLRRLGS